MDQHKKRRLRRWTLNVRRRRDRVLTLLGSIITFITFIVKEGIGENLKDQVSSIETAQNLYAIRDDIAMSTNRAAISQSSAPTLPPSKGYMTIIGSRFNQTGSEYYGRPKQI